MINRYAGARYTTYEFYDETCAGDPKGTWNGGDSYERLYRCRVPRRMLEKAQAVGDLTPVSDWLLEHEATEGVWL